MNMDDFKFAVCEGEIFERVLKICVRFFKNKNTSFCIKYIMCTKKATKILQKMLKVKNKHFI